MDALVQITPGMIEQLPCASCTAMCCGPVSIVPHRLELIRKHLSSMPVSERQRLARQKRDMLDCRFVDTETYRCTIYPVRPWVCEIYGRAEGLECPKVGQLVQIMPKFLVDQGFAREGVVSFTATDGLIECRGNEQPAGISNLWNWKKMEFE